MTNELSAYAQSLATLTLSEIDTAVALLWFLESTEDTTGVAANRLANLLHQTGLRGSVNTSRLHKRLLADKRVVRGHAVGSFRIRLRSKPALDEAYSGLLSRRPQPKIITEIIPHDMFKGTRSYLERLSHQINGSYQLEFYDGCAVLSRRIMESLLIEAFEATGNAGAIRNGNDYMPLSSIIKVAQSGDKFRLARGVGAAMDEVKTIGDTAAHNRTYITRKSDMHHLAPKLRRLLSELSKHAKIEPKT